MHGVVNYRCWNSAHQAEVVGLAASPSSPSQPRVCGRMKDLADFALDVDALCQADHTHMARFITTRIMNKIDVNWYTLNWWSVQI